MFCGLSLNQQNLSQTTSGVTVTALSGTGSRFDLCTLWYMARTAFHPQKLPNAEHNGSPLCKDKELLAATQESSCIQLSSTLVLHSVPFSLSPYLSPQPVP